MNMGLPPVAPKGFIVPMEGLNLLMSGFPPEIFIAKGFIPITLLMLGAAGLLACLEISFFITKSIMPSSSEEFILFIILY